MHSMQNIFQKNFFNGIIAERANILIYFRVFPEIFKSVYIKYVCFSSTLFATLKAHNVLSFFSALASAIKLGYISVNSSVSPFIAVYKFSLVSSIPPAISKWFFALTVSAAAAALKSLATCLKPSTSVFLAKARYFLLSYGVSCKCYH